MKFQFIRGLQTKSLKLFRVIFRRRRIPIKPEVLTKYNYNRIFMETGTDTGGGIINAIRSGFKLIYSIETSEEKAKKAMEKFRDFTFVTILKGDSARHLNGLLSQHEEPITFWLDARNLRGKSPLLKELEVIKDTGLKYHTILIDDMRLYRKGKWGITYEQIVESIHKINPDYKISFENGFEKNDILVAHCNKASL